MNNTTVAPKSAMFPALCHEYFWEVEGLLNNTCFQNTILATIPAAWLLLSSLFYIPYLKGHNSKRKHLSYHTLTKLVTTSLLISATITYLTHNNINKDKDQVVRNYGKGVVLFSQLFSLVLQYVEGKKKIFTSAINFIYYFLSLFEEISWLVGKGEKYEPKNIESILVKLSLIFKSFLFLMFCFTERKVKRSNPYENASFLSRLTFFWMTRVILNGYKQTSENNFVPNLMEQDTTSYIHLKYKATEKHLRGKHRHWFRILLQMFWKDLLIIQLIRVMYDMLVFANPILLHYFLNFLNDAEKSPKWLGYVYSLSFLFVNVLMSMTDQAVYWRSGRIGLNIKTAIIDVIYRKLLRKRGEIMEDTSIANLLSNDADIFRECVAYFWVLFSAPFQLLICFVILVQYIGNEALFCFLVFPMYIVVRLCLLQISRHQENYMNEKDSRRCLMKEIMDKIKVVKLTAQESIYLKKLQDIRIKELNFLQKILLWEGLISTISEVLPFVVTMLICMTLYFVKGTDYLSTENVFMIFMATSILETNFVIFPDVVVDCTKTFESYKRIDQFLTSPNNDFNVENCDDFALVMKNASFAEAGLYNLNLAVKPGELVVVCGKTGSGKSALIRSMIGCIPKSSGLFLRKSKVAYAPQNAWIMSGNIKDNITFGKIYNEKRFSQAVKYSALHEDLDSMKEGEDTRVIDQGLNLSGGQRSRINLARTIFSRPELFLLDDQLSALDATSTNYIIKNLFGKKGLLKEITRIIVTEPNSEWLSEADQVIVMEDGQIVQKGTFNKIRNSNSFKQLLSLQNFSELDNVSVDEQSVKPHHYQSRTQRQMSSPSLSTSIIKKISAKKISSHSIVLHTSFHDSTHTRTEKRFSSYDLRNQYSSSYKSFARELSRNCYMAAASMQSSVVELDDSLQNYALKPREFRKYLKIVGLFSILVSVVMAGLYQGSKVGSGLILEKLNGTHSEQHFIYCGSLGLTQALWLGLFYTTTTIFAIKANKKVHLKMIECLLYCPLSFFIENSKFDVDYHFFNNLGEIDEVLQNTYKMWANALFDILAIFLLIVIEKYYLIPVIILLNVFIWLEMKVYIPTVIKLSQMHNHCSSNLLSHVAQTESGGDVIAAFSNESGFVKKNNLCVDQQQRYSHTIISAKRWSAFILQLVGTVIIFLVCLIAINTGTSEAVGLIITYLIKVSKSLDWFVRMTSDIVVMKVSVQQVNNYTRHKKENTDSEGKPYQKLPENWPERGEIEFLDFSAKYDSDNTCCLSGVDLLIKSQEKIGIVGKSGSGKSSLIMALTRMASCTHGVLNIDGQNIFDVDPQDLRSKLVIFPQDCELFSGSLRSNLDPYNKFTDSQLYNVLKITNLNLDLEKDYSSEAEISFGIKQLIYLSKCLLKKSKVVILDEATANVSQKESEEFMKILEENFQDSTILCIAHKLDIVQKYNKILVMEKGENVEFGPPEHLLKKKNSYYYNMVLMAEKPVRPYTIYE